MPYDDRVFPSDAVQGMTTTAGSVPEADSLRRELGELLLDVDGVSGALLATTDGLLIAAHREEDAHLESVAALAAAAAGVAEQFTLLMRLGDLGSTVVYGESGCIAVHPIGDNAIIIIYTTGVPNVARLHLAVRQAVPRFEKIMLDA
jgi:predicted regulator of Ras-like GTPase activity (Roadblock/LC7/MglB family)